MTVPERRPRHVRARFIVMLVLALPLLAHAIWDYAESRRLRARLDAIARRSEPLTEVRYIQLSGGAADSETDAPIVRYASRSKWGPLLRAGIKIYEYQPTMYHSKVMIVDDLWVTVGSANFDNRSFRLNDEANLNVYSAEFAAQQSRIFEEDKQNAKLISYKEWKGRGLCTKLLEKILAPFRSQL